jgi:formylglycine-generating enzyme required for sulfatase activity
LAACRAPSTKKEWQAAALGTPDTGGIDNGMTDCNTDAAVTTVLATGSRSGCVSDADAFDMVGNLEEWVADWVPFSTTCPGWAGFSDDRMCLSGASTTATGPGAVIRGGASATNTLAGPFNVVGNGHPVTGASADLGFRCARRL